MNESKSSYYKAEGKAFAVYFDGQKVAEELTPEQAGELLDDLSYYGMPMYCVYDRKAVCSATGTPNCMRCREAKNDG